METNENKTRSPRKVETAPSVALSGAAAPVATITTNITVKANESQ